MRRSIILQTLALALIASGSLSTLRGQDPDDAKRGVARISLMNGDVSVRRGDSGDLVAAVVNAPLMTQDRVVTGPSSRAEIQLDSAHFLRLGSNAEVNLAEIENQRFMLQLARGTSTFRVLRDSSADVSVDTPNVSARPAHLGSYRITVREEGQTEVTARNGNLEVFSPRGSQWVNAGQMLMARGTASDPEFQMLQAPAYDDWDRWNDTRDQSIERTVSYRYVSPDVSGAEDLDPYGQWVNEPSYGNVWYPTVAAGWAPYRYGRWSWLDWYGWTWVSSDPWGWAPYHYGRWFYGTRGWCWNPGGIHERHYWSPALVAFFGYGHGVGVGVGFGWGNVGWVPLAPHEHFSPWWGRNYYGSYHNGVVVNRSAYITNNVNITNVYRNARVNNGVTAVNSGDFSRGRFNNYSQVSGNDLRQASLVRGQIPAAPGDAHLRYSDRQASPQTASLAARSQNTSFYSRRQPDQVQRVPFNDQRQSLARSSQVPVGDRSNVGSGAAIAPAIGAPAARSQANDSGSRSWQRFGDPAVSGSGRSTVSPQAATPRAVSPQANPSQNSGSGWRRFSDQPNGQPGGSAAPAAAPQVNRDNNSGGNWRRFGNPGTSQNAAPAATPSQAPSATPRDNGNWRRFNDSPSAQPAPSRSAESAPRSQGSSSNWQRFGDPGTRSTQVPSRSSDRPAAQQPSQQRTYSAPQRQESIRIAPPVVRERSSGGGNSGGARAERSGGNSNSSGHFSRSESGRSTRGR